MSLTVTSRLTHPRRCATDFFTAKTTGERITDSAYFVLCAVSPMPIQSEAAGQTASKSPFDSSSASMMSTEPLYLTEIGVPFSREKRSMIGFSDSFSEPARMVSAGALSAAFCGASAR